MIGAPRKSPFNGGRLRATIGWWEISMTVRRFRGVPKSPILHIWMEQNHLGGLEMNAEMLAASNE
jgi:hypothetical protein